MKDLVKSTEEKFAKEIENILDYITDHPETGGEEFQTVEYLVDFFKENGFEVDKNYMGYPTGFRACLKRGKGAKIGFLAKYDAIAKFDENGKDAHGCGHNWIAALCAGVGKILSELKEQFRGEIVIVGAPPELFFGEKISILSADEWKTFDAVFAAHLNDRNVLQAYPLPVNTVEIEFEGKASQAFSFPDQGVNALEAAFDTIEKIRAIDLEPEDRVSVIICDGGKTTEMIPDYSRLRVAAGALSEEGTNQLTKEILKMASEEAGKRGAHFKYRIYNQFRSLQKTPYLYHLIESAFEIYEEPYDIEPDNIGRSRTALDISAVSHLCPLLYVFFGVEGWTPHQPTIQRIAASHSKDAKKRLHKAVQIFSYAALLIMGDESEQKKIRESFGDGVF